MVTIYDIAKRANVSSMTVSRVINNSGTVKEETRKKVEQIIKELNYIPNSAARSLNIKETKILSLIITDITNPFFTKVARGAEDKAKQMGYRLLLSNSDESLEKESEYINMILSSGVDGVLIAPSGDQSKKNLRTLIKHRIPFVLIDREVDGIQSDVVMGDNFDGTRKLIEHIIQQGHRKIALINGPSNISTARAREKAFIETLQLSGIQPEENLMYNISFKQNNAEKIVEKLVSLKKAERPTAIFAANNFIAVDTVKALRDLGKSVPEDMAIVCFDDPEPIPGFNPFLTVAAQPDYNFGYLGVQLLIERIEKKGPQGFQRIVLPPEIHISKSSIKG
ncbi:LacI family transcriptional regulator [Scopulibacillus darangshiensis]|uniref:Catabolite control protein A n=1 Tax=Scopulibacillus darangshiensis TaxID=442528 RepID=A0A4R2P4B0_9BACL|nr:LacI family DNA-binding transcriptional regulator [Scopulibacillus darangshiensis]TCP29640.1 LacI family transcriptional regulator [Scopulibacillus darangshiensis]